MVRSFRVEADFESRLEAAANQEGVPVSVFIRAAVARRCDEVLGQTLADVLAGGIGQVDSTGGRARQTGKAFQQLLSSRIKP